MLRKVVKKSKPPAAHAVIPPTTRQKGTKESPILLLSDDESEGEDENFRPLAATQKSYLAMGYKPDRGLGPNLRGNVQPLPIELRKPGAGVGYRTTTVSRSPSPAPPPKKAPVKIIRPPREPVASTSKSGRPATKVTPQTSSQSKVILSKPAPHNPPKQSTPTQQLLSPLTVISPPPPSPAPFVPSDLYISLMSGLAMANMPRAMQVAAAADPMAAFQLAQMYFAPPSPFPLPPFSLVPPKPDPAPVQRNIHAPNLPPKPVSNSIVKSNPKIIPVPLPVPSPALQEGDPDTISPSISPDLDPLMLKQKRQARKNSIGWIPEPGFPSRGIFDLVPTIDYTHWSSSGDVTPPDPKRSLVMEDLPCNCRTVKFVRSWADQFLATAVHLNGNAKALIEFPSRETAEVAYDSPRLRGGSFDRATHVRVFWYRPQAEDVVSPPLVTTIGNAGATREVDGTPDDVTPANTATTLEESDFMVIDGLSPKADITEIGKEVQFKEKGGGSSPLPPDADLPVRSPTVFPFTPRTGSPLVVSPSIECDQGGRRRQSGPVDRRTNVSQGESERGTSRPPGSLSPSMLPIPHIQVPPRLPSPLPDAVRRKRTPSGSPPSLRYPSTTPEMTNDKERVSPPSEEASIRETPSPASTSDRSFAGDYSLEQQLRMRLLAVKGARIANQSRGRSSAPSTPPSTVGEHGSGTFFKTASPLPASGTPNSVAISESLESLATSFITDTIQAAQRSSSEPERFDTALEMPLNKKRGFDDAFGSPEDIAFKRQQLAQQIEESKKIMERWKAAKTKEERSQIYTSWEESNRSVEMLLKPESAPFQWPCYAENYLIVDSDDEEDMDLSW